MNKVQSRKKLFIMQIDSEARADILPEASIRTLALDGGNLVPKNGVDAELHLASSK